MRRLSSKNFIKMRKKSLTTRILLIISDYTAFVASFHSFQARLQTRKSIRFYETLDYIKTFFPAIPFAAPPYLSLFFFLLSYRIILFVYGIFVLTTATTSRFLAKHDRSFFFSLSLSFLSLSLIQYLYFFLTPSLSQSYLLSLSVPFIF